MSQIQQTLALLPNNVKYSHDGLTGEFLTSRMEPRVFSTSPCLGDVFATAQTAFPLLTVNKVSAVVFI